MAAMITSSSTSANINNSSSSSFCGVGFFNFRSNSRGSVVRHHHSPAAASCSKLDGVAMWLVNGVAAAFFASLDSCSCIRIATVDDADDGKDAPLIFNDGNVTPPPPDAGSSRRRRVGKGKKQAGTVLYGGF